MWKWVTKMKIYLVMLNLKTMKTFKKYFETEFERELYIRKSRFFKNIKVFDIGEEYE